MPYFPGDDKRKNDRRRGGRRASLPGDSRREEPSGRQRETTAVDIEKQLFNLAYRLGQSDTSNEGQIRDKIKAVLGAYPKRSVEAALAGNVEGDATAARIDAVYKAGIGASQTGYDYDQLVRDSVADPEGTRLRPTNISPQQWAALRNQPDPVSGSLGANWLLEALNRPSQAIVGSITEGDVPVPGVVVPNVSAGWKGLTGKESYDPAVAATRQFGGFVKPGGVSRPEAEKFVGDLPAPARFTYQTAAGIAYDPATYIGLGTPALSREAARTAAGLVATQRGVGAAEIATSPITQDVFQALTTKGLRALAPAERAAIREQTSRKLYQALRSAPGGVRIRLPFVPGWNGAGRSIPGTRALGKPLAWTSRVTTTAGGEKNPLGVIERSWSPRGAAREGVRRGELPATLPAQLEAGSARVRAAVDRSALDVTRAMKIVEGLNPVELRQIRDALEAELTGGAGATQRAIDALPAKLRGKASQLATMRAEDEAMAIRAGILRGPDEAQDVLRQQVTDAFQPKIDRANAQVGRLEQRRYNQSGRWANAEGRRQMVRGDDLARGEQRALNRAVEREAALERRAVASTQRQGNQAIRESFAKARQAERDAQAAIRDIERRRAPLVSRIRDLSRRADSAATRDARRTAQLQLRTVRQDLAPLDEELARAVGNLEDARAQRIAIEQVANRIRTPKTPQVPPRIAPREIPSRASANAAASEARAQTRLRVLENLKKSAETRVARLTAQRDAKVAGIKTIPSEGYLRHYFLQDGDAAPMPGSNPLTGRMPGYIKARDADTKFKTISDLEVEGFQFEAGGHPGYTVGKHFAETRRAVGRARYIDDLSRIPDTAGNPVLISGANPDYADLKASGLYDEVDAGIAREPGDLVRRHKVLVRREISEDFKRLMSLWDSPSATEELMRGIKTLNALWAGYATVPGPLASGFVIRNMQGNFVNAGWLAGAGNPLDWTRAMDIQHASWASLRKYGDPLVGLEPSARKLVEEALDEGVIDTGFFFNLDDARKKVDMALQGGPRVVDRLKPWKQEFVLIDYGRKVNSAVERHARLSLYLAKRRAGYSPESAAAIVRKYLYDYKDLSRVDEGIKLVAPFWTWTRKTVPLYLETIAKQPNKLTTPYHIFDALGNEGEPYPDEYAPDWMREQGAFTIPRGAREALPFLPDGPAAITPDLPQQTLFDMLQPLATLSGNQPDKMEEAAREFMSNIGFGGAIGGPLAALAQLGGGRQWFSGRPFLPGEYEDVWYAPGPVPREARFLIEQMLPALPKTTALFPQGEKDKEKQARRLVSLFTGQQFYPLTDQTRMGEAYRRMDLLEAIRREILGRGGSVPTQTDLEDGRTSSNTPVRRNKRGGASRADVERFKQQLTGR